jgi:hypothetical protein
LRIAGAEPLVSEILAEVGVVDSGAPAVLRQVLVSEIGGEVRLVVELEAGPADCPPGWTWADLDPAVLEDLEPEWSRATVASWVLERAEGWSPLRPAWSRPGWLERASSWMVDQMEAAGCPVVGVPWQHQLWGLSAVLRARSAGGDVFLKCSSGELRREVVLTRALADRMPGLLPEVLAVEATEGWLLMRDLGAPELGEQEESSWHCGVVALARLQQSWLGRADELLGLGLPIRSLTQLAATIEGWTADAALLGRMTADLRKRWLTHASALARACLRLDQIGPGPTLVHGDFHPWNVTHGTTGTRIFDWTDAAVSHPFVDLATYVFRTADVRVRQQVVDAYVDAWSGHGSPSELGEAAALGVVVGALYQAQTYRALIPTLMGGGSDDGLTGADLDWIHRSLSRHQRQLHSRH